MKNERLTQIRGARSQAEFARLIGVHKNTIARYESGTREPDAPYLRALMAQGFEPRWILTGEGPMRKDDAPMSQSARLDPETITTALQLVNMAFSLAGTTYDLQRDPDLLAMTYDYLVEHGGEVTGDNLVDFQQRLEARRKAKEGGDAKQQDAGGEPARTGAAFASKAAGNW